MHQNGESKMAIRVCDVMAAQAAAVRPTEPIRNVVRLMHEHRVGAVMVADGPTLVGIFTERDLVRFVSSAASNWERVPVAEWMTRKPHTIASTAGWEEAVARMEQLNIRHLPVVEGARVVGIVSSRQLIGRRNDHLNRLVEDRTRELNATTAQLIDRDQQLQYDLNVAGRLLNRALVPGAPVEGPRIAWAVRYSPLDSLGGDYYDFVSPDPDHVGVLIADASGHSVPAAMVAIMARISFAEVVRSTIQPAEVLREMNARLMGLTEHRFVTAFFGIIDLHKRQLTCASAGHPHPIHFNARTGACGAVGPRGFMLGVVPDVGYEEATIDLGPGDRLCFFTDGVPETINNAGESFGETRLVELVLELASMDAGELLQQITVELTQFRGEHAPPDDLTVLVAEIK